MDPKSLPIFERYPAVRDVPWTPLIESPTPVRRLARLGAALGGAEIWLKDDGASAPLYGGNKPRKLEFLLGDALRLGRRHIVTAGALGSNHCLATTIHARRKGLAVSLLLTLQPVSDATRRQLLAFRFYGAELRLVDQGESLETKRRELEDGFKLRDGVEPYWIPVGGTTPLGDLGFINAALELAQQIARGDAPEPTRVYTPAGSMGTMAGLVLGLKLAGLRARVFGVRVSPLRSHDAGRVLALAEEVDRFLHGLGDAPGDTKLSADDFDLSWDYYGEGYGYPTAKSQKAVALMAETEGIKLENTYTGKALAALIDAARAKPAGGPYLFWNTFNSVDYLSATKGRVSSADLPPEFAQFFTA